MNFSECLCSGGVKINTKRASVFLEFFGSGAGEVSATLAHSQAGKGKEIFHKVAGN